MIDATACQEHFNDVKRYADTVGLGGQLQGQLDYLDRYANRPGCLYDKTTGADTRCRLFKDFAPHSFEFLVECHKPGEPWKRMFNGGLIFHPAGSTGVTGELSVRLGDCSKAGWMVHT